MKWHALKLSKCLLVLGLIGSITTSCNPTDQHTSFTGLDSFLDSLITAHQVPGISFAVFNDREIVFEHVSGLKSQETKDPVDAQTTFEAASISKPLFASIVLTLAQEGYLDLEKPLTFLPDFLHDDRFSNLTPQMLLSHQSGLPNWRSRLNFDAQTLDELFAPDDTLKFIVDPDTEYNYSGEGYILLQRVVEHTMQKYLNQLANERVFEPLGMVRSSFLYDAKIRTNTSLGHNREMKPDKWEIVPALASTTLHTTATDLARFGIHLVTNLQEGEDMEALAEPVVEVERMGNAVKSWGSGLGVVIDEHGKYVYHGGNNVIFMADFIYGFEENLGYALLTNSANGAAVIEQVEQRVFGRDVLR